MVCNAGLGRDFTLDDLSNQGFDAVVVAIGCYDTNKLGIPGEDAAEVLDGLEYLRTATLGLPYPDHAGKRVVVIGGGFTSMDCSRTSVRQGASEVTLVYRRDMKDMPASNEVHEAIEEGVTAIFQAGPVAGRHSTTRATSPASSSSGWPSASPTRPAAAARSPRPAPSSSSRATACSSPSARAPTSPGSARAPRARRPPSSAGSRPTRSRSRPAGRASSAPATCASARRPWSRPSPRAAAPRTPWTRSSRASTSRSIRNRQTLAEPQPEFLSIVPFTGEIKEPRYRMAAMEAEERNHNYIEYELPYTREAAVAESTRCLQCTCEAIGFCDLRRLGIEYGTTLQTLEPQYHAGRGLPERDREPLHGRQPRLRPRRLARVHPARAVPLHRLRPLRPGLLRGRRRRLLRLHAHRLRHARDDAAGHEPQRHAVRLVRPLRGDVPDRRPDAQAARPAEVRGRREPLHPVRDLRRRVPLRRAARRRRHRARPHQPVRADDRPDGDRRHRPRDRDHLHPPRARLGRGRRGRGPAARPGADAPDAAADDRRACRPATATGTATDTTTRMAMAPGRRCSAAGTSRRPCSGSWSRSSWR